MVCEGVWNWSVDGGATWFIPAELRLIGWRGFT